MDNLSPPVLDQSAASYCGCFASTTPMPMGCAACGHAPYAHGCPGRTADHDYVQPDGSLMRLRLEARRLGHPLPVFEPPAEVTPAKVIPPMPAQCRPDLPAPDLPVIAVPAVPAVRPPLPKRTPRPVRRPAPPLRAAAAPPRRKDDRRPAPRSMPAAIDGPPETETTLPAHRPPPRTAPSRSFFPTP